MSDRIEIRESETGVVRVFAIDLPPEAIERFTTQAGTGEWPLQYALGADRLRPGFADVVAIRDLGAMSLSAYLAQGYDLAGNDFRAVRPRLDALRGHVLVLPSAAFGHTAQVLNIRNPLRWIATFNEPRPATDRTPLRSAAASGTIGAPAGASPPARGRIGGLVIGLIALGVLAVLGALLFGLAR